MVSVRHLRNPAHSLRPIISVSHPKSPHQRVEREAQIAEIARRPQRRVLVDADDTVEQQRWFAASLHPNEKPFALCFAYAASAPAHLGTLIMIGQYSAAAVALRFAETCPVPHPDSSGEGAATRLSRCTGVTRQPETNVGRDLFIANRKLCRQDHS
jgi:hypothetical protein